jgi:hypothetical protein
MLPLVENAQMTHTMARHFRHSGPRGLVAVALLGLVLGCRDAAAPPLDPALTGRWVQYGTDTYALFVLEKRGNDVTGTFGLGGPSGAASPHPVTGVASLPHVVLHWTEENGRVFRLSLNAILSADGQTLSGNLSVDDEAPGPTMTFYRAPSD